MHTKLFSTLVIVVAVLLAMSVTAAQDMQYKEAPMLAEMVAAGELPPVEERLPENPQVVEPVDSIGVYGGTWHRAWRGVSDFHAFG
ncbi:MAG: ABC transporter substrate-binding protein, partial [Anaerolineae bacterium]|nr:ABC transporter substrate-binding protein [Anaerolineae bacterium]